MATLNGKNILNLKNPLTCSHWEEQNYRVFLKIFLFCKEPLHSFGQRVPKCTPILGLSQKNFLRKFIPSLVPTGGVHLGTVVSKKGKKICPPT